jgi:hypothetical protein
MRFPVRSEDDLLTTRSQGEGCRLRLEHALLSERPDCLEIDFDGIEALTISFGDEFIGRLLTELHGSVGDPVFVLLTGLNVDTAVELEVVLERRKLLAASCSAGSFHLLGGDRYLKETYASVVILQRATPGQLAERLGTSVQNVNNRMKRLVSAGALQRARVDVVGGGREFVYEIPNAFRMPATA